MYEATEAETGSRPDPMPRSPKTEGMDAYERARAEEEHDEAMEQWAARYLMRQVKAAQKRKERIQRKVEESNRRKDDREQEAEERDGA